MVVPLLEPWSLAVGLLPCPGGSPLLSPSLSLLRNYCHASPLPMRESRESAPRPFLIPSRGAPRRRVVSPLTGSVTGVLLLGSWLSLAATRLPCPCGPPLSPGVAPLPRHCYHAPPLSMGG